jgi:hypothetical protein
LTRIDLPFLEDFRSNWVVVIGLDLLSLQCPGLGFDTGGVPDLSVSGDNFDLVEDDPHDLTTMSEPKAPMQSLNQLPVVTNLVDARSA